MDVNVRELRNLLIEQAKRYGIKADSKMSNQGAIGLCDKVLETESRLRAARNVEAQLRYDLAEAKGEPGTRLLLQAESDREPCFIHTKGAPMVGSGKFCCIALDEMMERYDLPLEKPFVIHSPSGECENRKSDIVALKMMNYTPSRNISAKDRMAVIINFCPFCGARIGPEEVGNDT